MEQPLKRIGLGVVPLFIFAGLLSSAYTLIALRKSELHEGGSHIIAVLVGGLCLGLMLVTALWFYERLASWRSAALLVAIMSLANGFSLFDKYVPQSLRQDNALPLLGITEKYDYILFFPTCLVALIGFAIVLFAWRHALRTVPIAFAFSVLATLAFNYKVEQGRDGWINLLPGDVLGIVWQITLVVFLALSLWVGQIRISARSSTIQASHIRSVRSTRNGFISLSILFSCFVGVQLWTRVAVKEHAKEVEQFQARVRVEITQSLADAPSRENLPPLEQEPVDEVLLEKPAGCTRFGSRSTMVPAENVLPTTENVNARALRPKRYSYTATYAELCNAIIPVEVTAYPTAVWARYVVMRPSVLILYPKNAWKVLKLGNNLYQVGTHFSWSSGNKVIFLDCRVAQQSVVDALLNAYLAKYPSSL
jgi:hypothetical protein